MLSERPRGVQIVLAAVVPFLFGAVVGVALGTSAGLYWGLSALAAMAGALAGLEHEDRPRRCLRARSPRGSPLRGGDPDRADAVGGGEEKVSLGSFPPLLIVIDAVIGMLLGRLGARLGARG